MIEAKALYTRAIDGTSKYLGFDHPSTITIVNNLAVCLKDQGKIVEYMYTSKWKTLKRHDTYRF